MPEEIDDAGYTASGEDLDHNELSTSIAPAAYRPREGLFIHTFQGMAFSLEFAIFSWWPDRHTVINTACPGCQRITQKSHWMATVSETPGLTFWQGPEIHQWSPVGPNPKLMSDCSLFPGLTDDDPRQNQVGHPNRIPTVLVTSSLRSRSQNTETFVTCAES